MSNIQKGRDSRPFVLLISSGQIWIIPIITITCIDNKTIVTTWHALSVI